MKMKRILLNVLAGLFLFSGVISAQTKSPLDEPLADLDKLISNLKVSSTISEPIRVGDTYIIPFARISFGLGAGGAMMGYGGGMGSKTIPLGILVVEGENVRVELFPEEEKKPSLLQQMLPILLQALPQMLGGKPGSSPGGPPAASVPKEGKPGEPRKETTLSQVEKLFGDQKFSEALEAVDSLLAKDPNNADLHAWKGSIMGNLASGGNPMDMMKYGMGAMQEFEKALTLDPNNIRAHFGRGMGRLAAPEGFGRDYDGAIEDFSFICEKKPSAEAFYQLGVAYRGKGVMDKAKQAFQKALALKPGYAEAAKALAETQ
jgi:uncharacterized spore protein YtfJ